MLRRAAYRVSALSCSGLRSFAKPSSFGPSPSPIWPFVQRRSSYVRPPRVSVCREWEQPSRFPEPSPKVLFGQPRSSPELISTAFEFLFLFRMCCRKLQAQRRFREVPWSTDLVPSLTTGRLPLNWTFSFFLAEGLYKLMAAMVSPTTGYLPDCRQTRSYRTTSAATRHQTEMSGADFVFIGVCRLSP